MTKKFTSISWITLIIIPLIFLKGLLTYYPDYLWFSAFHFGKIFQVQWLVFAVIFGITFGVSFFYLFIHEWLLEKAVSKSYLSTANYSQKPSLISVILAQILKQSVWAFSLSKGPFKKSWIIPAVLALGLSFYEVQSWETWALFLFRHPYGLSDPIWGMDIGFYLFVLPFFKLLLQGFFFLLILGLLRGVYVFFSRADLSQILLKIKTTTPVRLYFFGMLSGVFFWLAGTFVIKILDLLFGKRGVVFGAGFTDIHAQLLIDQVAIAACLLAAATSMVLMFKVAQNRQVWTLGVLLGVAIFILPVIYPITVQQYQVVPNELGLEMPFLKWNIAYTRKAYQLDKIMTKPFSAVQNLSYKDLEDSQAVVQNIRLWNEAPLRQTFGQLQEIRPYYTFSNIDVDRYQTDKGLQQVLVSPRELTISHLPIKAQTWVNEHLVYTHGFGVCMSPVTQVSDEGLPLFYIKDLPPSNALSKPIAYPEIYFSETQKEYSIVHTKQPEFDYPKGDSNIYSAYKYQGGVQLDSFLKRLVYAIKFSDINMMISELITPKSRLIYDRDIQTIVNKLTPFIYYENDPYLVVEEGHLFWMLDGFTMSAYFPYSEPFADKWNYIRNSVKVTIDATTGDIHFYIADTSDPIIKSYAKLFDGVFEPLNNMPQYLRQHCRYPKTLFDIQAKLYSTYHMVDPQVFYNREDIWALPKRSTEGAANTLQSQYMVTKLPDEQAESFVLMQTFTPANKSNLIAWMGAKCEQDTYGQLTVFEFPKERTIYGPEQIESRIDQDTEISQKLTLWGQVGSRVIRGDLLVIPVKNAILYIQPIYLQATTGKLPELKRVIVAYHDNIVMSSNLETSLRGIFDNTKSSDKISSDLGSSRLEKSPSNSQILTLKKAFNELKKAAAAGQWLDFGKKLDDIEKVLNY